MNTKVKVGNYIIPLSIESEKSDNKLILRFPFSRALIDEIKAMSGARWNPEEKYWTVDNNQHNNFQLAYLMRVSTGYNPYEKFDRDWNSIEYNPNRENLYSFQVEGIKFLISRLCGILAYDTGLGKSLIAIEALEYFKKQLGIRNVIWVGPKSALVAANYEFSKWKSILKPTFYTYDSLKNFAQNLSSKNIPVPEALILDEVQKLKNPMTQRSQAARFIADKIREEYKENSIIIGLSGTPAPHSPCDYFNICETIVPGFLKEGTYPKFQARLALIKTEQNNITGGSYPHLLTWFDDERKCKVCGQYKDTFQHDPEGMIFNEGHSFEPSKNEVANLYKRMRGLTLVKFKKDVLRELPDKVFREIICPVSESTARMANLILKTCPTTIQALTLLRELSDGFQYKEVKAVDKLNNPVMETCELCKGSKVIQVPESNTICPHCNGSGKQQKVIREVIEIGTPKDQVLQDLLDEYEDIGRIVIGAGFTGTIDKITKLVKKAGWNYIQVDGRGWQSDIVEYKSHTEDMIKAFQEFRDVYPKIAFVANPGSGGTGLTLTASPVIVNYSCTFNGEDYAQFIDRIHRIGTDINRGATIVNLIHLETDRKVLNNLEKKMDLQKLTLGDLSKALENREKNELSRYF